MNKETKRFWIKGIIFFVICFSPLIVQELLPFDFFNYRVWEAVAYKYLDPEKQFYPKTKIEKIEEGELGYYTPYSIKKKNIWIIDEYGFRNYPSDNQSYDIVIVGDSFTVGSGLSQEETLSYVLSDKTGLKVYQYAYAGINDFISDERFVNNPPKIVVFEKTEREPIFLTSIPENITIRKIKIKNPILEKINQKLDSLLKLSIVRYSIARLEEKVMPRELILNEETNMLFYKDSLENQGTNLFLINSTTYRLIEYNNYFKEKGIKFIFLPIPSKETIYASDLPEKYAQFRNESPFLSNLIKNLKKADVAVIDTLYNFKKHKNEMIYVLDDTHWNQKGINLTAELIIKKIKQDNAENQIQSNGCSTGICIER